MGRHRRSAAQGAAPTTAHSAEIDSGTVEALCAAPPSTFYNESIKDEGTGGKFSCRDKPGPEL